MKLREFRRKVYQMQHLAMQSSRQNKKYHMRMYAAGRAKAYQNVIEWLDLFDKDAKLTNPMNDLLELLKEPTE